MTPRHSERLRQQPSRDTSPELRLRKALHKGGHRYRVHYPVPGMARRSIDVAFPKTLLAVFVDGCFWHGCPEHRSDSRTNRDYWLPKLERNRLRDQETDEHLRNLGWKVMRIWEHQLAREGIDLAVEQVQNAIKSRRVD